MTNASSAPDPNGIPHAEVHLSRKARMPLVWVVPLIAAAIGGWMVLHTLVNRGPSIVVAFADAEGIEVGKTKVRFKNVDVGQVRRITLAKDLHTVEVAIDMEKFARPLLVKGTRFWVERPRLGAGGVSGLSTLLSGDYIGMDVGHGLAPLREFSALKAPPVVAGDIAGTLLVLESKDLGSLEVGAPAYFRHVRVGQILSTSLNPDGHGVTLQLFVEKPYDRFVTSGTRFWHASGVDVEFDGGGVRVRTESLATVLAGGVAFETPGSMQDATQAAPDTHFRLAATRELALKAADGAVESYILYFTESVRGLHTGASVDFHGVDIGDVQSLKVEYDRQRKRFLFPVLINLYPERIRDRYLKGNRPPTLEFHSLLGSFIEEGLRAQLRSSSLLTGELYIALDFFPHAANVKPDLSRTPMVVPTVPGNLTQLQDTLVSVAQKLNELPLHKIAQDADEALVSLNGTLGSAHSFLSQASNDFLPSAKLTVDQARTTLAQAGNAIGPDGSLQSDLHTTLISVGRAADSIRTLADFLDQHPESLLQGKRAESK